MWFTDFRYAFIMSVVLYFFQLFLVHYVFRDRDFPRIVITVDNRYLPSSLRLLVWFLNLVKTVQPTVRDNAAKGSHLSLFLPSILFFYWFILIIIHMFIWLIDWFIYLYCRRLFSIMSYFLFFFNILVGLFSGFLRITLGIVLGVVFLARIDRSTLMQGFQRLDRGMSKSLKGETVHGFP